jgi:hypothetical protein
LGAVLGDTLLGDGTDDFAGGRRPLGLVVAGNLREAAEAVAALEARLAELGRRLEARGFTDGEGLYRHWASSGAPVPAGSATGGG